MGFLLNPISHSSWVWMNWTDHNHSGIQATLAVATVLNVFIINRIGQNEPQRVSPHFRELCAYIPLQIIGRNWSCALYAHSRPKSAILPSA